ncbi:uncharacterized protein LOC117756546 [Hippoglossus hippoglossus]|uniref:uncharacterized protein LOC117756546 n=1 Tax=Hippoglossus hippoglossus TaxID=8267 RepID=UPI00148C2411|nr:uncharacterized protein LOC117756546 [Hippoglossus hippoglossus]
MLKAQECQKTMWKNIHQTGRCMKIPRVRTQKERLSMLWIMLMILCTFLTMLEVTLQLMNRKEDLVTLSFNMSQTQQDLFQLPAKRQRYQRAVTPLQDNSGIQLDKGARDQLGKGLNQTVTRTRVEVTLGKSVQLPCQCTGENSGEGKLRVEWKDSHGKVLVLLGTSPLRKYTLINDKRRLKVEGDCSLYVYRPQQEDQGDYRCSFYDPRFGSERSELGFRVRIVTLMIKDLSPIGVADSSVTAQRTISDVDNYFFDSDQTPEHMTDQYHTLQKRETKWKAFGFDPSVLQIADPWASRNLWFQQLTHSVRSVTNWNGPCVVKIPSPNSWPSILETA